MTTSNEQVHSDWELVQQVLHEQNDEAFRVLYRRYSREILRRLYRMLNDEELARDALQQVFLEAYRSLASYRGESRFGSWLHRIAERIVFQWNRKDKQTHSFLRRWGSFLKCCNDRDDKDSDPEKDTFRRELASCMQACLNHLSPAKRSALLLCDVEGQTYDELAQAMDVSAGTIASRLHHARKELKHMLSQHLQAQGLQLEDIIHAL